MKMWVMWFLLSDKYLEFDIYSFVEVFYEEISVNRWKNQKTNSCI